MREKESRGTDDQNSWDPNEHQIFTAIINKWLESGRESITFRVSPLLGSFWFTQMTRKVVDLQFNSATSKTHQGITDDDEPTRSTLTSFFCFISLHHLPSHLPTSKLSGSEFNYCLHHHRQQHPACLFAFTERLSEGSHIFQKHRHEERKWKKSQNHSQCVQTEVKRKGERERGLDFCWIWHVVIMKSNDCSLAWNVIFLPDRMSGRNSISCLCNSRDRLPL